MNQNITRVVITLWAGLLCALAAGAQGTTRIIIQSKEGKPLSGASLFVHERAVAISDEDGYVFLELRDSLSLMRVSHTGYKDKVVRFDSLRRGGFITLEEESNALAEVVVSTGYQTLPKERATGSFTQVDSAMLNLQAGPNIINRLNGVASSLLFDANPDHPPLTIRGISSFEGPTQPLIVVDNFPYEGNIANLNPNDVESVTVLKDAAAASIWGTRAGNGVIVITTKKGKLREPVHVSGTVNTTVTGKPDLFYLRPMTSSDFIDVETSLFDSGFYMENTDEKTALTPVVELLIAERDGRISPAAADAAIAKLRTVDVRHDFEKYLYSKGINRQYAVNLSGGSDRMSYYLSAGYDDNSSQLDAGYHRFTMRTQSVYKPVRGLQLTMAVNYADSRTRSGKPGYGDVYSVQGNALYPYAQFADDKGNPLPLTRDYRSTFVDTAGGGRLLEWHYYPLTDYQHATSRLQTTDLLATVGASYTLLKGLDISLQYNYEKEAQAQKDLYNAQSYFARNLVNLYTQVDPAGHVSYPVPVGGILDLTNGSTEINNLRAQATFNRQLGKGNVSFLAGWETRQARSGNHRFRTYGYDDNVLTYTSVDYASFYTMYNSGYINTIPDNLSFSGTLNRFVSGYVNGAYTYANRYTVSGSVRKDASNLFGVESNQKGVPLYSMGAAWEASKEAFYHLRWLSFLKLRTTYGFSGNADPSRSAVTTMGYIPDNYITHLTYGNINQIANPQLTWEKTKIVNTGIDFSARGGWFSGSLDYYRKDGFDLFGPSPVDVTTGLQRPTLTENIASMNGHGVDIDWQFKPVRGRVQWNVNLIFNYNLSHVKNYYVYADVGDYYVGSPSITPIPGKAVYSLLSYRWGGLSSSTGDPQGYVAGKKSTDYTAITSDSTHIADLVYSGPSVPPLFGSLMNSISIKGFTLTLNISYKLGYYFRKPSINYSSLFYGWNGNADYAQRWQKPGDEAHTDVPSFSYPANSLRDRFYQYSEALVRKAANVRLQFVNLDYTLTKRAWKKLPVDNARLYIYASNLGILWKANREGLDPDYPNSLPPAKSVTIGLSVGL